MVIKLEPEQTADNNTIEDLVDDLNELLKLGGAQPQWAAASVDSEGRLVFLVVDTLGSYDEYIDIYQAYTETVVTEKVTLPTGETVQRHVSSSRQYDVLGFPLYLYNYGLDAMIVATGVTGVDGGAREQSETDNVNTYVRTRTSVPLTLSVNGDPVQILTLTTEITTNNANLGALVADLGGLLNGAGLADDVTFGVGGDRVSSP